MLDSAPDKSVALGFERDGITLPLAALVPTKAYRPTIKLSSKYKQILTSVQAVGLVEPPAVIADPTRPGQYFLLDGHLRVEALKDLGVDEVVCLVATDDEGFTYNKRINRLSAAQEHRMVVRAKERGVSEERLAQALGMNVHAIERRVRLLDGICPEAAELLKDAPCPMIVFDILRKMTPLRQVDAAVLMIGQSNFSRPFALALLAATPEAQLVARRRSAKAVANVSREQVARLERELASLQVQTRSVEETYGVDNLHLTVARAYLVKLLGNGRVCRWLQRVRPEYLEEFRAVADLTSIPSEAVAAE